MEAVCFLTELHVKAVTTTGKFAGPLKPPKRRCTAFDQLKTNKSEPSPLFVNGL